ncbi:hypothetical protein [Metabacillus fastidiosus]|uniref:hypothetical protein n=1 Tax=Metabacillus fastidiosus TaxID=1458 RepID=UPI003D2E14F7
MYPMMRNNVRGPFPFLFGGPFIGSLLGGLVGSAIFAPRPRPVPTPYYPYQPYQPYPYYPYAGGYPYY